MLIILTHTQLALLSFFPAFRGQYCIVLFVLHSNRGCEGTVIWGMFPRVCEDTIARSRLLCRGGVGNQWTQLSSFDPLCALRDAQVCRQYTRAAFICRQWQSAVSGEGWNSSQCGSTLYTTAALCA